MKSSTWISLLALVVSLGSSYFTWDSNRANRLLSLPLNQELYKERVNEYSKLLKILKSVSSKNKKELNQQKCKGIVVEMNDWLYGRGGLVASGLTNTLAFQFRDSCFFWEPESAPKKIKELQAAVFYSVRNDLDLVSRKNINLEKFYRLKKIRDDDIEKLHEHLKSAK